MREGELAKALGDAEDTSRIDRFSPAELTQEEIDAQWAKGQPFRDGFDEGFDRGYDSGFSAARKHPEISPTEPREGDPVGDLHNISDDYRGDPQTRTKPAEPPRPEIPRDYFPKLSNEADVKDLYANRPRPEKKFDLATKIEIAGTVCGGQRFRSAAPHKEEGVEDKAWEEDFDKEFGGCKLGTTPERDETHHTQLKAFFSKWEAAAQKEEYEEVISTFHYSKADIDAARADAVREERERVNNALREYFNGFVAIVNPDRFLVGLLAFLQEKADD